MQITIADAAHGLHSVYCFRSKRASDGRSMFILCDLLVTFFGCEYVFAVDAHVSVWRINDVLRSSWVNPLVILQNVRSLVEVLAASASFRRKTCSNHLESNRRCISRRLICVELAHRKAVVSSDEELLFASA